MSNPPIGYQLDGTRYIVVAANDTMYGFAMYPKKWRLRRVPWRVSSRLADSDSESITPAATVMGVVHPCLDTGPGWRVYRRGRAALTWQQAVVSLQTVLGHRLVVGGRTALERQGYAHFLSQRTQAVYLYGPARPPAWLSTLPLDVAFVYRNSEPPLMSITTRWRS